MFERGDRVRVKDTCKKKDWVGLELEVTMPEIPLVYSGGIAVFAKKRMESKPAFFLKT